MMTMLSEYQNNLDCAVTPLQKGVSLIEASAGTGKTYAIAMLVLRCVAELNIPIEKILVVTFTKAATEELRSRVRARLVEARSVLKDPGSVTDSTMLDWAATVDDPANVLTRIQLALYDIDRASIFTIHSFCQRMLTEQALESGQFFDVELLADFDHIRNQVVEDYWRKKCYALPKRGAGIITEMFSTPDSLYGSVSGVGGNTEIVEPETPTVEELLVELDRSFASLAKWWNIHSEEMGTKFSEAYGEGKFKKPLNDDFQAWWEDLSQYMNGESYNPPSNLHYLTRDGLKEALNGRKVPKKKQDEYLADWPLPESLAEEFQDAVKIFRIGMRRDLALQISTELEARMQDLGYMSFDDLISRLDSALQHEGEALKLGLQQRFSAALIDEFQDTDSAQWRIFSTLFGGSPHYLYLIGDPKQAIYKFRGADIYSYFAAAQETDHKLTLPKNYRSHPDLVEEVNRIFSGRENPFAFDQDKMGFEPVLPAKSNDDGALYHHGQQLSSVEYCQLPFFEKKKDGRWTVGNATELFRDFTVREICKLLDGREPAMITKKSDGLIEERPLKPQDIAVLVRSNRQGDEYLQAFAEARIPAVVNSRKGVFETEEALDLYRLMQPLAMPANTIRLKSAMTISWFGFSGDELHRIWTDDTEFDRWFDRFQEYNRLWKERGFLAMMNSLIKREELFIHLATKPMAERRIANVHHLLELVQEEENNEKLSPDQTLIWLHSMLAGKEGEQDRELRLESDEQAVKIVTMHSAKGLQYPVVFCPYLWHRGGRLEGEENLISCHREDLQKVVDIGSDYFEDHRQLALNEELAEDLRLAYVALTRAELRCYVMWVDIASRKKSVRSSFDAPLGYLLFPDGPVAYEEQTQMLQQRCEQAGVSFHEVEVEPQEHSVYKPAKEADEKLQPLLPSGRTLHTDYQMSSYSAMASLSEHDDHGVDLLGEGEESGDPIIHPDLPAGATFGNLIHDSLEQLSFASLALQEGDDEQIARVNNRYGIKAELEQIKAFLSTIVSSRLFPEDQVAEQENFSLSMLDEKRCLKEMEFYFHMSRVATEQINSILAGEPTVVPLSHATMQGYLTGFVDLVCEYEGKLYILDYKTNYLGEYQSDYDGERLVEAMASHNYGLQYWIYSLILHRHLKNVKPDYSYKHHFGGVLYLFVRGMTVDKPGNGVFYTLPSLDLLEKLEDALGESNE